MTEGVADLIEKTSVGGEIDFYIGLFRRKAVILEKLEGGDLVLNMIDGGNSHWEPNLERIRSSPEIRTVDERPVSLYYRR